jgi:hypothetical protein
VPHAPQPCNALGQMGYAPAQALLSVYAVYREQPDEAFSMAQSAAGKGDRRGIFQLANCFDAGIGCVVDKKRAIELYKEAAELESSSAQCRYSELAFGEYDWERYYWQGRAAQSGMGRHHFSRSLIRLLPSFESGQHGRILHTAAPVLRASRDGAGLASFGAVLQPEEVEKLHRVVELHEAMLGRARCAVYCLSLVCLRRGVAKDVQIMIAKMAWEEPWLWSANESLPAKSSVAELVRDSC